ncbi:MAG: alpha/beta fold hydrolase [Alphaproteobacteria bacterium]
MPDKTHLLFLPGLLCDARLWAHQLDSLSDMADMTVADLSLDDNMHDMAARTLAAAPPTFALAGLSMGGYVAQEILRQAPERVRRLALIDTSPYADSAEQSKRRRGFIDQVKEGHFRGVTSRLLPMLIHEDRLDDAPLTGAVKEMAKSVGKDAFIRQQTAIMGRIDGLDDLAHLHCPTLILCGRQDALTPLEVHEIMAEAISGAALVVVEDSGHLAPLERPRAVSAALRYWLQV